MSDDFARVTAVEKRADGQYEGAVEVGWDIAGVPNGGYLLAIAGQAMAESIGRPPLAVTAHYLAPAHVGPCSVLVESARVGRRTATLTARFEQDSRESFRVLGTFGETSGADAVLVSRRPPELPPYEDCVVVPSSSPPWPALYDRLAVRWRPGDEGFMRGRPTGRAEVAGWFAFSDAAPTDAIGLLLVADAFAPPIFNIGLGPGWVPTLELTVHIRAVPAPGPLRCVFRTQFVQGGLLSEDGEIWDTAGVLVAQSRQLALTPRQ
ncbi:MAG: thioesterase family protein [Actinomycetota bacterium]|nr:thioesterase family protein [Actinomycetota bacterium]